MNDPIVSAIDEAIVSLRRRRQECRAMARQYQARYERHGRDGFLSLRTLNNLRNCAKLTAVITMLANA